MIEKYSKPEIEVADIFNKYEANYRQAHNLPLQSLKMISAIPVSDIEAGNRDAKELSINNILI